MQSSDFPSIVSPLGASASQRPQHLAHGGKAEKPQAPTDAQPHQALLGALVHAMLMHHLDKHPQGRQAGLVEVQQALVKMKRHGALGQHK